MGYKFAEGDQGLSAEDLKDEWSLETTVNVKNSTPGTYFMSVGWSPAGYGGIQELSNSDRTIIFSMWNGGCQFGTAGKIISHELSVKKRKSLAIPWLCS